MRNKWWLYLAWFLAISVSLVSSLVVIIYGITFGAVKAETWIAGFLIATIHKIVLFDPIRLSLVALWRVHRTRKPPPDYGFTEEFTPLREQGLRRIKRRLNYLMELYRQKKWKRHSSFLLEQSKEMEESLLQYNIILNDLLMFIFYMLALLLIVMGSKDDLAYYSTRNVCDFFTSGKNAGPSTRFILTEEDFFNYLNQTILEKLHKAKLYGNHTILRQPGYLDGQASKLLGVARLRQHRIRNGICPLQKQLNISICDGYYSYSTMDTNSYSAQWKPWVNFKYSNKYWRVIQPWTYMTAWESESQPVFGFHNLYPGGGYTANLGRNYENSNHVLQYLFRSKWFDHHTAVVFIELTLYSVNANLFNIVTIVAERMPYGSFSLRIYVQTSKLLFIISNMHWSMWLAVILFFFLVGLFTYRLVMQKIYGEDTFTHNAWHYIDAILIILSLITGVLFLFRNVYVVSLLESLEHSRKNTFRSFSYATIFDDFFSWMSATLVCISTIRLWKVLHFALVFRVLTSSLYRSAKSLAASIFLLSIFLIAISTALHVINGSNATRFSTITKSFTTMMAFTASFITEVKDTDLGHGGQCLGIFLYGLQAVVVNIFLLNMIITLACFYFDEMKAEMSNRERNKYSFFEFLKDEYNHYTAKIFHHDYGQYTRQSLRLRGGGGFLSKFFSNHKRTSILSVDERAHKLRYSDEKAGLVNEIINVQMDYLEKYVSLRLEKSKVANGINVDKNTEKNHIAEDNSSGQSNEFSPMQQYDISASTGKKEGASESDIEEEDESEYCYDRKRNCLRRIDRPGKNNTIDFSSRHV